MRAALLAALALAASCGGKQEKALAPVKDPPPRLGPEPAGKSSQLGAPWIDAVHERFHARFADTFLEQCRLYLPADHPVNDAKLEAVVIFAVAASGAVHDVEVTRSSGNRDFDAAALEVVAENGTAAPLPRPPVELRSDDGDVHVVWRFARDARQDGVAGASIERRQWELERAVPALLAADRIVEAAERVAGALEAALTPEAARALVPAARRVASAILVDTLIDEKDAGLRVEAARALAAARWAEAAPVLRRLSVEASDLVLQAAALRALGDLGDATSVEPLLRAVAEHEDERSAAAAASLVKLGKGAEMWALLGPALAGTDADRRAAALADLAEAPVEAAAPALEAALRDRSSPRAERVAAARALGGLSGDGKALFATLSDGDAAVRAASAAGLARAAEERGLRAPARRILPLLRDRDPRVQAAAARAAAGLDGKGALSELVRLSQRGSVFAVEALGSVPGPEALAALSKLAGAKATEPRLAALRALARRPEPEARALVAPLASDPDPALRALGVAATEDVEILRRALGDRSGDVRAAAVAPLLRVAGPEKGTGPVMGALAAAPDARGRVLVARELLLIGAAR